MHVHGSLLGGLSTHPPARLPCLQWYAGLGRPNNSGTKLFSIRWGRWPGPSAGHWLLPMPLLIQLLPSLAALPPPPLPSICWACCRVP